MAGRALRKGMSTWGNMERRWYVLKDIALSIPCTRTRHEIPQSGQQRRPCSRTPPNGGNDLTLLDDLFDIFVIRESGFRIFFVARVPLFLVFVGIVFVRIVLI